MKLVFRLMLYAFAGFLGGIEVLAQEGELIDSLKTVYVFEMKSDIDPRMNRKVKLALEDAGKRNAAMIIVHMDTYGGAVNDADAIRTLFLESPVPIHSFIDKDAASAGALISIACDSIYMAKGGSIGAATVVMGGTGEAAPDKYQSYMRSMMRSTAEATGRNPRIAEAMVDENIEVEGVSKEGEVVTFSVSEAIQHGFCEAEVSSINEIVARNGIENFEIYYYSPSVVEDIIAFFLNPAVSGFLILIAQFIKPAAGADHFGHHGFARQGSVNKLGFAISTGNAPAIVAQGLYFTTHGLLGQNLAATLAHIEFS